MTDVHVVASSQERDTIAPILQSLGERLAAAEGSPALQVHWWPNAYELVAGLARQDGRAVRIAVVPIDPLPGTDLELFAALKARPGLHAIALSHWPHHAKAQAARQAGAAQVLSGADLAATLHTMLAESAGAAKSATEASPTPATDRPEAEAAGPEEHDRRRTATPEDELMAAHMQREIAAALRGARDRGSAPTAPAEPPSEPSKAAAPAPPPAVSPGTVATDATESDTAPQGPKARPTEPRGGGLLTREELDALLKD